MTKATGPKPLADYVGQPQVREDGYLRQRQPRQDAQDHLRIDFWPSGLGKTTLANIEANEMGVNIRTTFRACIRKKAGDLAACLLILNRMVIY